MTSKSNKIWAIAGHRAKLKQIVKKTKWRRIPQSNKAKRRRAGNLFSNQKSQESKKYRCQYPNRQ